MTPAPTPQRPFADEVADADAAHAVGDEYVTAVGKVIASHVRNELAGAVAFDEPAIALAPGPQEKWLACRIAMEEYGHHLRFQRLALELGLAHAPGRALSVFDFGLESWVEFVVLKAVVDLAEVVLMEELLTTSYLPLRALAIKLLPEERFHVSFGRAQTRQLARETANLPLIQRAVDELVAFTVPFFGRSHSANNELFRRWGIKHQTNDESRRQFIERSREFVIGELAMTYPAVDMHWSG